MVPPLLKVFALFGLNPRLLDLLLEGLGQVLDADSAAGQGSILFRVLLDRKWEDFIVAFILFLVTVALIGCGLDYGAKIYQF